MEQRTAVALRRAELDIIREQVASVSRLVGDDPPPAELSPAPRPAGNGGPRVGRAFLDAAAAAFAALPGNRFIRLVIDSGCTWHAHPHRKDLINVRPTDDSFVSADGTECKCDGVGDMPVICKDSSGKEIRVLLQDVRLVPSFTATLISVRQLEEEGNAEVRFGTIQSIITNDASGELRIPFKWRDSVFSWIVRRPAPSDLTVDSFRPSRATALNETGTGSGDAPPAPIDELSFLRERLTELEARVVNSPPVDEKLHDKPSAPPRKLAIHSSHATSHVAALPPDEAAQLLHQRLHVGVDKIRRLSAAAADVPPCVAKARVVTCEHCAIANAPHLAHPRSDTYEPSHPGRLVHADIAGPFRPSRIGNYRYVLVLVDDHSRWKSVYFLRNKSEAPGKVRQFIASFNALASIGKAEPVRVVGALHTDNAGELLSREFNELLDSELVAHSTCPAHVHQLNGVAERAIRSIFSLVRSQLVASHCPVSFWDYAVTHAVDVLNRTSGPPGDDSTSYALVTGNKPRIMSIMPFGCRAIAVRPSVAVSKTNLESKGIGGINLGRDPRRPGSYFVWIGQELKVVSTSDVYFLENHFPWRDSKAPHDRPAASLPSAAPPGAPQPPGLPDVTPPASPSPAAPAAQSLGSEFERVVRPSAPGRLKSRRVLIVFSGKFNRVDGLSAFLRTYGLEADLVDNDPAHGGGSHLDLLNDDFFHDLWRRVTAGEYFAIIAAPPCSTFSVSRFFSSSASSDGGPPPVRNRSHVTGLPDPPAGHDRELKRANDLVRRTCQLLSAGFAAGSQFILENPSDHGDPELGDSFMHADHAPLWLMPNVQHLRAETSSRMVTFPQCMLGAPVRKDTTLMYTLGFAPFLSVLHELRCTHVKHEKLAGGSKSNGAWESAGYAAYPAEMNMLLATACSRLHSTLGVRTTPLLPPA